MRVNVYFRLFLEAQRAGVEITYVAFEKASEEPDENTRRLVEAIVDARLTPDTGGRRGAVPRRRCSRQASDKLEHLESYANIQRGYRHELHLSFQHSLATQSLAVASPGDHCRQHRACQHAGLRRQGCATLRGRPAVVVATVDGDQRPRSTSRKRARRAMRSPRFRMTHGTPTIRVTRSASKKRWSRPAK